MKLRNFVCMLSLLVLPAISFAEAEYFVSNSSDFSIKTDSSETRIFKQLFPMADKVNQPSLVPVTFDFLNGLGCLPRGQFWSGIQIQNLSVVRDAHVDGILRKGQTLEIEFNICNDSVVGANPSLWLEIKTRDLTNFGESGVFNKNTDATITLTADGNNLPLVGPVYRNNGYKRALRELGLTPLRASLANSSGLPTDSVTRPPLAVPKPALEWRPARFVDLRQAERENPVKYSFQYLEVSS